MSRRRLSQVHVVGDVGGFSGRLEFEDLLVGGSMDLVLDERFH
jgi:hypothetical protein